MSEFPSGFWIVLGFWILEADFLGGLGIFMLVLWAVLALATGKIASGRGREPIRWVIIAFLVTPVIVLPLIWFLGHADTPGGHSVPLGDSVRCPTCEETVSASLSRCTNCGEQLPTDTWA